MRRVALTLLWMWLLQFSVAGTRAQSLYGPGGLFLYPTANVPPKGQLTTGMLVLPQRIPFTPGLHKNPTWGSFSIDYGLTDDVEIGVTSLAITDFKPSYGGFIKYRFLQENRRQPAMAVGVTYTGSGDNDTEAAFLGLRKQLTQGERPPVVGHAGVLYVDMLAGIPYDEQLLPYGGVEWVLTPQWTFIAEARARGRGDFKVSTGLTVVYKYGQGNQLALTWANTGQSTQPRFGFGVGFRIGTRR
jgi:hypothetical protein